MVFLLNLSRLLRPLSSVKNFFIALVVFAISPQGINLWMLFLGIISLSLVCCAVYAFNSVSDFQIDRKNPNKQHYSSAVAYFGSRVSIIIVIGFFLLGLAIGLGLGRNFVISLVLLALAGFLYSSPVTRFKDKPALDVLFAAALTYPLRFSALWFIGQQGFPPPLILLALSAAKSGGYIGYKQLDRGHFVRAEKFLIVLSVLLFFAVLVISVYLYLNPGYLLSFGLRSFPREAVWFVPFIILPSIALYLKIFGFLRFVGIKQLRAAYLIYSVALVIIFVKIFYGIF